MKICLVRHGETDWNVLGKLQGKTDIPLNQKGKEHAEKCGNSLKNSNWDLIVSSPLRRAKETAIVINNSINAPIIIMDAFKERDYGIAEGMDLKQRLLKFPDKQYPMKEPRNSLNERVLTGMRELVTNFTDSNKLIVVSHGSIINTILSILSNGKIGSGKTILDNGSISEIYYQNKRWEIKNFNQTGHLDQ